MDAIRIRGARQHNLKNLDVDIPRGKLVVITGPSGSGKSSLAFHTLYAEGQRRYVESLSTYARQFLEQLDKPDVDSIEGLSPAIAIDQKSGSGNPRSTIATTTEIYDYLRVLYAAAGIPHDPATGDRLVKMDASEIVQQLINKPERTKLVMLAPVPLQEAEIAERLLGDLQRQGFVRLRVNGEILEVEDALAAWPEVVESLEVVVDRLVVRQGVESRLADSVETCLRIWGQEARCLVQLPEDDDWLEIHFATSYRNPATGYELGALTPKHFSFNSLLGACPDCHGLGTREGCVCAGCGGGRLKPEILAVKLESEACDLGIQDFCGLAIEEALLWLRSVELPEQKREVSQGLVDAVVKRLQFLDDVGLGYLTLNRVSSTLSGGESQRIRLATQIGAGLSGVIYVLDEPSIGLHQDDNARLITALLKLRDVGNTVVVVEHDEEMMRAADWIIDLGPVAGPAGGYLLAAGTPEEIMQVEESATGKWLRQHATSFSSEGGGSRLGGALVVRGACEHNLQNINVSIPLGKMVCVTGPSGSGKSTLVDDILRRALAQHFHGSKEQAGKHESIQGMEFLQRVVVVDQKPLGKSPRSNPATYTGALDLVREIFAKLPLSRQRGYKTGRFSFNVHGGRCERCAGDGAIKVDMSFLSDVYVKCDACQGRRYNRETLEVAFKGRSIADVLDMTAEHASEFFSSVPKLSSILRALCNVGLGYIRLGQAANTLSGGEAQRVKLAAELAKSSAGHTLYLLDEPTTGLHFQDVEVLLHALRGLRDAGNSLLIVEHNLDVIRAADWIIDLGPGGGKHGGQLMAEGTPFHLAAHGQSATAKWLKSLGSL